ncbi:MAG TPA: hypothetical protein VJU16_08960 [Planctomycetota bacterium]|nr:hypothetical protein [Planctomycetota bacterium]
MGLNLSQVYLRNIDFKRFTEAIGPAWTRVIEPDQEPRRRQLLVLFRQPWIVLVDSTGDLPKSIALELSGASGGEAIRVGVSSTTLTAETYRADNGEAMDDLSIPAAEPGGVMPFYTDPEIEIWNILQKIGVPPELRLLRVRDISARKTQGKEQGDLVLFERKAPGEKIGHGYFVFDLKEPRGEEDGPAAEFSIFKADQKMLADIYVATVTPDAERVDHLLNVLEGIARRKPRPPLHHYMAVVTPDTEDEPKRLEALAFLRERYRELAKTRPLAFTL